MSCSNPMLAVRTDKVNPETGKPQYKFLRSVKNELQRLKSIDLPDYLDPDKTIRKDGRFYAPARPGDPDAEFAGYHREDGILGVDRGVAGKHGNIKLVKDYRVPYVVLPCGQCLQCRTSKAAEWADRIMLESRSYEPGTVYFITLTYDDQNLPRSKDVEGNEVFTLFPRDLELFVKRLRKQQSYYHDNKIRFYAVGEYGTLHHRPHYHLIVFGLHLDDVKEAGKNKQGRMLHDSLTINDLWGNGLTEVDLMDWKSAAYCARYTVKKLGKLESDFYRNSGLIPEFSRMSNKPGLASAFYDENADRIYSEDRVVIPVAGGIRTVKPSGYFDRLYDDVYPEQMKEIKANRQSVAENQIRLRLQNYSGSYLELLAADDAAFKAKTKSLRRLLE